MKQLNKDAKNFVNGIVEHLKKDQSGDRQFPKVKNLLQKVSADAWKDHVGVVTTAVPLSKEEKDQLVQILSKRMGHDVTLETKVSSDIVGGIRIEISDFIIDLSFEEELKSIGTMLVKGS
jgi:F-type H+-transporting ATPase subunit delta